MVFFIINIRTLYSLPHFLLMIFANSFDPDQARHFVGPDLDQNCLTLLVFLKYFFGKDDWKNQQMSKKHAKFRVAKVREKSSGKRKYFQVREKSGNYIFSQGN